MDARNTLARLAGLHATLVLLAAGPLAAAASCNPGSAIFQTGFERVCEDRKRSAFVALAADLALAGTGEQTILAHQLELEAPAQVLLVADGRHFPQGEERFELSLTVDGEAVPGSRSVIDWRESRNPVQHGFRVLALAELEAGTHELALRGALSPGDEGGATIGSGSGLALFVAPDSRVSLLAQDGPTPDINIDTFRPVVDIDVNEGDPDRPYVPVLEQALVNVAPEPLEAVALFAGTARQSCDVLGDGYGDVLWGLWADDRCPDTGEASWSVNDLDPNAEFAAPLYGHGAWRLEPGSSRSLALGVSELAFGSDQETSPAGSRENQVCHQAEGGVLLTAIGAGVLGGADEEPVEPFCSTYTWRCIGSTENIDGCPEAGSWVVLGARDLVIPPGHDGIVYFSAITRIQGDQADGFVTGRLRLRVDGQFVGTVGVQQLAVGAGQASRTLSASWLSAPGTALGPLAPGTHQVEAVMAVDGELVNFVSAPRDLPLVFFD